MTEFSSNRDLDIEAKVDIPASHRTHDFLKDIQGPGANGQVLELHGALKKQKAYIDKLNAQLLRYQALMPLVGLEEGITEEIKEKEEPDEFINLLADHPLIQAYEQHAKTLEKENKILKKDLDSFKIQYETLSKEAQQLTKKLLEKTKQLAIAIDNKNPDQPAPGENPEKYKTINELRETYKKEMSSFFEQMELAKQRNSKLESENKVLTQINEDLTNKNKDLVSRNFELQNSLDIMAHEKENTDRKYGLSEDELKKCKSDRDELENEKTKLETDLKLLSKNLEQYKVSYEEQETRKTSEISILEKELTEKEIILKDQKTKLFVQERELDDIKDINRKLQRDLDQTKNDFAQMLKIMEDYEAKIALFDEREKSLKALETECKKKLEDAKLIEEEAKNKEKQHQRQMTALENQWKEDINERQKKFDTMMGMTKDTNKALLDKREDELSSATEKVHKLESTLDKVQADLRVAEEEKSKYSTCISQLNKEWSEKNTFLESRLREITVREMEEKQKLQVQLDESLHELSRIDQKAKELEGTLKNVKLQLETESKKSEVLDKENKDLRATCNSLSNEKHTISKEIDRVKRVNQTKLEELEDVYNVKVKTLGNEIAQLKDKYKTGEEKLYTLLKQQEGVSEKWRTEHQNSVKYFEKVVTDLNNQMKTLRKENATMKASKLDDSNIIVRDKSVQL